MASLLLGVSPTDVVTFALVTIGLLLVALLLVLSRRGERRKSIRWWRCVTSEKRDGSGKKEVDLLIHTRLEPGDREGQEKRKPFKRFPVLASRSSPG